jgi:citrate lyase subunit beta/citryl-CoA lyase
VLKAFRVLDLFRAHRQVGVSQSAELLGITKANAHRLLVSLATAGALERTDSGQYRLSIWMFEVGAQVPLLRALTALERRLDLEPASLLVLPLLESARGLAQVQQVAAGPRVLRLGIGEADLVADLGILPSPDRQELWPYRAQVVLASAASGIAPPVGPVETDVRNDDQLLAGTRRLLTQGFRARTAIHPRQLATINTAFAPTADDVRAAEEVVRRYEEGAAAGVGATTTADGRLVDLAVVKNARRVLELAGRPEPDGR